MKKAKKCLMCKIKIQNLPGITSINYIDEVDMKEYIVCPACFISCISRFKESINNLIRKVTSNENRNSKTE
jgi:hypothetical protein